MRARKGWLTEATEEATACETLERAPPTAEEAEARLVESAGPEVPDPPIVTPEVAEVNDAETPLFMSSDQRR